MTPPPVIHRIRLLHSDIYTIGHHLAKRDKLGLHQTIEKTSIELLSLSIEAAFGTIQEKIVPLKRARTKTEALKNLIRTEHELEIIDERTYLRLSEILVEISKMIAGWISYTTQKGA